MMKSTLLLSVSFIFASQLYASPMSLKLKTKSPLQLTDSPIVFALNKDAKQLERIDLSTGQSTVIQASKSAKGFHFGHIANRQSIQAFIIDEKGVYLATNKSSTRIIKSESLLTRLQIDDFKKIDFVLDVNNDGLSDIYLPGFTHSELYIQQPDGLFNKHQFKYSLPLRADNYSDRMEVSTNFYSLPTIHDFDKDGKLDLVFRTRENVSVLYANENGFKSHVEHIHLPTSFGKTDNNAIRTTHELLDINQDGNLDLITRTRPITEGISALEAKIEYDLYLGQPKGFNSGAIKLPHTIGAGGMRIEYDFDGDGLLDLQTLSVDIGLTTIAAMALGGGKADVDVEMHFFKQHPHTLFAKKPSTEKEVELEIDMKRSMRGIPFYTGDLNGDNKHDIVFKSGDKTLNIYYGTSDNLLKKERRKINKKLPENANDIVLVDIDGNGKEDFIFKYADEAGQVRLETLLN
ncbi:VCBS repeat-containing protein [Pseudoalteromonas luteoviolacea]|uniref:FG-GAP repeat domain-containing protein n=1 Tax=Pseudoalteromonas luteoviolacea TaxID=43657 RepID=UPI001B3755E2|nr:VCBS repeat-containing protein [Pseudoalteromonas luteoviolacea]MBQ4811573.1 VCBS repeat-containing protein [Pseudoalteromonas luteoviolacea]